MVACFTSFHKKSKIKERHNKEGGWTQGNQTETLNINFLICYLGDENRQELLNLGALELLLKQVLSEDKVVRRNATMCLGTMAQNG